MTLSKERNNIKMARLSGQSCFCFTPSGFGKGSVEPAVHRSRPKGCDTVTHLIGSFECDRQVARPATFLYVCFQWIHEMDTFKGPVSFNCQRSVKNHHMDVLHILPHHGYSMKITVAVPLLTSNLGFIMSPTCSLLIGHQKMCLMSSS